MINLPNTLAKGENLTFALNKSLVIAAVSDSYWSDSANISKCIVVYKSTSGHQRKRLEFDFSQESPIVTAEWSAKARNGFEIEEIVLIDFDSGSYTIPRASLPSGKGISFSGESGGGGSVVTQVVHNYVPNGAINDMVTDGTNVYIGGAFTALRYGAFNASTISATTAENQLKDQVSGKFPSFNGQINCFAYDGPDVLYVGGAFTAMNGSRRDRIAKLNRVNGIWVSDSTFNPASANVGLNAAVHKILVDGNDIFVLGYFTIYTGPTGVSTSRPSIVKISKTTGALQSFNARAYSSTSNAALAAVIVGNKIYIGGRNSFNGALYGYHLVRVDKTTGAFDSTWPDIAQQTTTGWNTFIYDLKFENGYLYVAGQFGSFLSVGGTAYSNKFNLFRIGENGVLDTDFQAPWTAFSATNHIKSILFSGSDILAGGAFNDDSNLRRNLVKLNATTGARISEFNPGYTFFRYGQTSSVEGMFLSGGSLFAFGRFDGRSVVGDAQTCINIAKVNPTTGALDSSFASNGSLIDPATEFFNTAVVDGANLIIGGLFSGWGGYARQGVAKLTKDADGNWKVVDAFNTSSGGTGVNTLALSGNDLYIGGTFTTWAGAARNRVAKLNATTGALDPSFGVGVFTSGLTTGQFDGLTAAVNKLIVDGSDLVIAGAFATYSKKSSGGSAVNTSTSYWIRVNTATNTETVPSFGPNSAVQDMLLDDSEIVFLGNFASWANLSGTKYIARANKLTGEVVPGWSAPNAYYTAGPSYRGLISGNNIFIYSFTNGVGQTAVTSSAGGVFVINRSTGVLVKTYPYQINFEWSHSGNRGKIFDIGDYVYFLIGRSATPSSAVRRVLKTDLSFDTSWGFSNATSGFPYITAAEYVSNEFIVATAGAGTQFFPIGKTLYSLKLSDASQNFNI